MGRAARRRKAELKRYLINLSYTNPQAFEKQWQMRVESWLSEIEIQSKKWKDGEDSKTIIFKIMDYAINILECCEKKVASQVYKETYNELIHGCSSAVARVVYGRFYRLSNTGDLIDYSRKSLSDQLARS